MTRITISHARTSPDGSTTETIVDEYAGPPDGLRERVALIRAALGPAGSAAVPEIVFAPTPTPEPEPAPVAILANGATVSTATRPIEQPWNGTRLFAWSKTRDGALEFLLSHGAAHGYPPRILQWSPIMCERAYQAWQAERSEVA